MAEMMEALQRKLEFAFLGGRFWTFAEIGALALVLLSFKPYFIAYNVTAIVVLVCALAWDFWRNAPKSARYGMALIVLASFVFLLYNSLGVFYGWWPAIHAPAEAQALGYANNIYAGLAAGPAGALNATAAVGHFTESTIVAALGYAVGGVASLLFLVSGLMGLMACRKA